MRTYESTTTGNIYQYAVYGDDGLVRTYEFNLNSMHPTQFAKVSSTNFDTKSLQAGSYTTRSSRRTNVKNDQSITGAQAAKSKSAVVDTQNPKENIYEPYFPFTNDQSGGR